MPGKTPSYKGELSFGLEFEFLFYFKAPWADVTQGLDAVVVDEEEEARLPPALSLPDNVRWDFYDYYPVPDRDQGDNARGWATRLIREAILSVPGARIQGEPMPDGTDPSHLDMYVVGNEHRREFAGWLIDDDASVSDHGIQIRGYDCMNFELSTPALWDRPKSHRHVYLVVQELVKRFRLRVNVSSGLHCHIGAGLWSTGEGRRSVEGSSGDDDDDDMIDEPGFEWVKQAAMPFRGAEHDLGVFKRAAALLWAVDGFLCHVHPPERGLSRYAPPIRLCSRLAHGLRLVQVADHRGCVHFQELRLDNDNNNSNNNGNASEEKKEKENEKGPPAGVNLFPEQALPSSVFPRLYGGQFFLPVVRPNTVDKEAEARFRTLTLAFSHEINPDPEKLRVQDVYGGVAHILRCRNHSDVAGLLTPPDRRPISTRLNYNFAQYLNPFPDATGRTVEFRESAGSLSPAWVAAWSAVCLGIFRFARDAPADRFWTVLARLAAAEKAAATAPGGKGKEKEEDNGNDEGEGATDRYDAISFLLDIGLFAEAALLEARLRPRHTGGDPVRAWYPCRLADAPPGTPVRLSSSSTVENTRSGR
ncbi:hypothetical protein VTH82DRAFT_3096 [Thermothelomyces myriococcoides]